LLEGVSIWPSELIRLAAASLSSYFLVKMTRDLRANAAQLGRRYELTGSRAQGIELAPRQWLRPFSWGISHRESHCDVARLWQEHLSLTDQRWNRIIPQAVVFFVLAVAIFGVLGSPGTPARGLVSLAVDRLVLAITVPLLFLLVFFVVDETRLLEAFISRLRQGESEWPPGLTALYQQQRSSGCVPDWLDIRLLAERTSVVGTLLYYPFIVIALMIVSRARIFDNWDFPPSLALIWGLSAALAVLSTIKLSIAAERARRVALDNLAGRLYRAKESGQVKEAEQIAMTIGEIENEQRGAFASWIHHPVLKAILVPSGGVGVYAMLEYAGQLLR
jgi:hypothetical protein